MKDKVYINGIGSISAQPEEAGFTEEIVSYQENIIPAISPNFKEKISPVMLRRMSKAVKMSLWCAKKALLESGTEKPDAIITGTGEGCKQDTEKFLENILLENEGLVTPTAFIQSTHNTVGGQIALDLGCTGYNVTYTQNSASMETALIDALLQFEEDKTTPNILVGGVEEIAKTSSGFGYLDGQLKKEQISNLELLKQKSEGTIFSEGAQFFSLSGQKKENSYALLRDVKTLHTVEQETLEIIVAEFLKRNSLEPKDIDLVMMGVNGDSRFDVYYKQIGEQLFKNQLQLAFKHLSGDYKTVSGYAMMLACKIIKRQVVPEELKLNDKKAGPIKNILIYNQYLGMNHSLILLSGLES